jgi:F420H(2)-dependent biliverdin reductase
MNPLTSQGEQFLTDRHLGTLTTLRADGTPHVTPVGFTWDGAAGLVRVITNGASRKAVHAGLRSIVALCQLDGRHWLTLEGIAQVSADEARVADAVARYAVRYRQPRVNPERVVIEIQVTRVLGSAAFISGAP